MSEPGLHAPNPAQPVAAGGCLLRIVWTLVGNATIFLALAAIALTRPPLPSSLDYVVAVTVVVTLAARWLDITHCEGRTLGDERATPRDWRRYVVVFVSAILAAWALAHLIAGSFSR